MLQVREEKVTSGRPLALAYHTEVVERPAFRFVGSDGEDTLMDVS